jgi:hypothetical protein
MNHLKAMYSIHAYACANFYFVKRLSGTMIYTYFPHTDLFGLLASAGVIKACGGMF